MARSSSNDASAQADRFLADGRQLPDDFDAEEAEFARLLNDHFDLAGENLPPRYAQTLLGPVQYAPASDDFEDRIADKVFERLGIERPVPAPVVRRRVRRGPYSVPKHQKRQRHAVRQSVFALLAVLMLVAATGIASGAAFAGMFHLIVGRGGAQVVSKYPALSHQPATSQQSDVGDSTIEFLPQWSGKTMQGYTFAGMDIYKSLWWTQGALVLLHYQKTASDGLHQFDLLEFEPNTQVALQVVQDGAASNVALGSSSGVFISGQWTRQNHQMVWAPGMRAELICRSTQNPNVVIWLAVENTAPNQQDTAKDLLLSAAGALTSMSLDETTNTPIGMHYVSTDLTNASIQPFNGDVIALTPNKTRPGEPSVYIQINLDVPDQTAVLKNPGMSNSQ